MKKLLLISSLFMLMCSIALSQDKGKKEASKLKMENKYEFTREEFRKAVLNEVEIHLKRIGKSKISDLAKEVLEKEEELMIKSMELDKQKEQHKMDVKSLGQKITEFNQRQSKLLVCLNDSAKEEQVRVNHMVQVISGMKPNVAAEVLAVQDSQISIKILALLEPANVSKIFNLMDKEVSARLQKQYMTMKR